MIDSEVAVREMRRLCALIENDETGNHQRIIRQWYQEVSAKESKAVADSAYRLMKMTEKVAHVEDRKSRMVLILIGSGFAAFSLSFLMYAAMQKGLDDHQMRIIRVISSICAAASAGFMSGAAIMRATFATGALKVAMCGTAGIAVFFVVFLLFNLL